MNTFLKRAGCVLYLFLNIAFDLFGFPNLTFLEWMNESFFSIYKKI